MHRRGEVKICGPIADAALQRGHEVRLVWKPDAKPGEAISPDDLYARWPQADLQYEPKGIYLVPLAAVHGLNAPVPHGVEVVSLDYCLNHLSAVPGFKCLTFTSQWQFDLWREHAYKQVDWPTQQCRITGDTSLDGLALVTPEEARTKFGFGPEPIVVVFSLKFGLPGNYWRRYWYRWVGYRRTLEAIRGYCDRIGAKLVIKTRAKNQDPYFVGALADRVIIDEDLYPATSTYLLRCADLAIHWQSGAVYEGVAAGVRQISIKVPHPHLRPYPSSKYLFEHVPRHSPQWWPDVVTCLEWSWASWFFHRAHKIPKMKAQQYYTSTILGQCDFKASSRVLDAVEAME